MKYLILLYLFICVLPLVGQDTIYKKFFYPDGTISSEGTLVDGKPDGYWKNYYPDSVLKSEGRRTNMQLDSIWNFYDEHGFLNNRVSYLDGKKNGYNEIYEVVEKDGIKQAVLVKKEMYVQNLKDGKSLFYDYDGNLIKEIPFIKGKKQGTGFEYNKEGIKKAILSYFDDKQIKYERINRTDAQGNKTGVWKDFHSNGTVKYERYYLNNELHGAAKTFNHNGEVEKIYKYQNDKQIDEQTYALEFEEPEEKIEYYENGVIQSRRTFKNNVPIGIHRFYNKEGIIINSKVYTEGGDLSEEGILQENGAKQGKWTTFYINKKVKSVGEYKNNKKEGNWKYYYENGSLKQEGVYKNNVYSGVWIWYFPNQQIRKKEEFFQGKQDGLSVEYDELGNVVAEGMFAEGFKNGKWFHIVGDNKEQGEYRYGEKNGMWTHTYPDGKKRFEGYYSLGNKKGKHKYFFQNGNIEHIEYYKGGKKNKKWIYYNKDGTPNRIVFYKNNKEIKIITY